MEKPSLGKILLLAGGISAAIAVPATAEGQMETAQNSQTSNVPLERTITLPHVMQLNDGIGFSNSVPNVLKDQPLEMDKIGLKLPGENHYTAINSKKAIINYASFLWDHSGKGEPYTIARRDPLIQQKADLIHELLTRYKLASPKDLEAMTKAVSNGVITMEEWKNIPDGVYTIVDSNGEESTSITMNVVSGKVVPLGEIPSYEKPSLSPSQLDSIITQTAKQTAEQTLNAYLENQQEQYKLGHATGPEARGPGEAMNTVHGTKYMSKLQKKINKQHREQAKEEPPSYSSTGAPDKYKLPRETKRERKAKEHGPVPANFFLESEYSAGNNSIGNNFLGGSAGFTFGYFNDPVNVSASVGAGVAASPLPERVVKTPQDRFGFSGKNTYDFSQPWYLAGGLSVDLALGKGDPRIIFGLQERLYHLKEISSSEVDFHGVPFDGPNSSAVSKNLAEVIGFVGIGSHGWRGQLGVGYFNNGQTDFYASVGRAIGKQAKKPGKD